MKDFSRHPIRTPLSLYRSFRFFKFFSAKSFYLSRSFLARFLSLYRLFPFSNFFFPKYLFQFFLIFFKFSFTNSYLLRFFFVRFLSPYRFLPFSKPFFANYPNYLSRFFLIFQIPFYKLVFIAISLRFLSLYRFFPSIFQLLFRKVSEAIFLLRFFLPLFFSFVSILCFFVPRSFSPSWPPNFREQVLNLDRRSSAKTIFSATRFVITRFFGSSTPVIPAIHARYRGNSVAFCTNVDL